MYKIAPAVPSGFSRQSPENTGRIKAGGFPGAPLEHGGFEVVVHDRPRRCAEELERAAVCRREALHALAYVKLHKRHPAVAKDGAKKPSQPIFSLAPRQGHGLACPSHGDSERVCVDHYLSTSMTKATAEALFAIMPPQSLEAPSTDPWSNVRLPRFSRIRRWRGAFENLRKPRPARIQNLSGSV